MTQTTNTVATASTKTPAATTRELEEHEFDAAVRPERLTVVDFSATWCGPCRMLEPILGELAAEMPSIDFVKLDVDRSQQIAIRYGVQAVPTLLVLRSGRVVDRFVGLRSKGELAERLRQHDTA
ncbi:MAG TPA: thioredoxin [Thermoanaerobaculia bacterium]|jgi:thioredoxin 1|nr:thioredoxin [Thermoanaerobaculia bacterium]